MLKVPYLLELLRLSDSVRSSRLEAQPPQDTRRAQEPHPVRKVGQRPKLTTLSACDDLNGCEDVRNVICGFKNHLYDEIKLPLIRKKCGAQRNGVDKHPVIKYLELSSTGTCQPFSLRNIPRNKKWQPIERGWGEDHHIHNFGSQSKWESKRGEMWFGEQRSLYVIAQMDGTGAHRRNSVWLCYQSTVVTTAFRIQSFDGMWKGHLIGTAQATQSTRGRTKTRKNRG